MINMNKYPYEIYRNPYFFANIQWFLYKYFGIRRTIPCGRRRKEKYLCCCQEFCYPERFIFNEDHTEVYCKVCGSRVAMSNVPFKSLENIWEL